MILKCLAVDDEPLALDIIEDYVSKIEFLELSAKCTSALDAIQIVKNQEIDLMFLDIQMPDLSGFEFLETLRTKPLVIFTSAYDDYAAQSYNYNAIDYLIKPFSFSRFLKAIDKAHDYISYKSFNAKKDKSEQALDYIFINSEGNIVKVFLDDIYYMKGMSDFIELFTKQKKYVIRDNLKDVEKALSSSNFMRVHKSYIVSIPKIDSIESGNIIIGNDIIPIGRSYKNILLNIINQLKLG